MAGDEPGQGPLEAALVQRLAHRGDLQHRVAQLGRVAAADGDQHVGHRGLLQGVEPAGGPEIQQAQPPIIEQPHVAGVGVGVEPLAFHHQPQRRAEQDVGELALVHLGLPPPGCRDADTLEFFHHQHPERRQVGEDGRDGDLGDIVQPGGHLGHVAGLGGEVQLGAEVAGELGGQLTHPVGGAPGGVGLDPAGQPGQDGQVALDHLLNSRALDLDDDLLPAGQHSPRTGEQNRAAQRTCQRL
jgi:hypothetical protein